MVSPDSYVPSRGPLISTLEQSMLRVFAIGVLKRWKMARVLTDDIGGSCACIAEMCFA